MFENIIPLDSIYKRLFKVSEEILDKNIDNFIIHNLEKENKLKNNHRIFYSYLNFSKEYFICYYENTYNAFNPIDLICLKIKNKNLDKKRVLVYFEDYFLLFNHSRFYYFQKIEKELISQDIKQYVEKRFMFEVNETYHFNISDFEKSSKEKNTATSLNYLNDKKILNRYFIYLISLLLVGLSTFAYDSYNKTLLEKEKKSKYQSKKKQNINMLKDTLYYKTSLLLNEIEKNKLKIKKFAFSKKSVNLTIILSDSTDAYTFLQKYKNIKILTYKKIKDGYEISSELIF